MNKSKVLVFNDDLEELNSLGYFKYLAYPVKKTFEEIKNTIISCAKRKKSE